MLARWMAFALVLFTLIYPATASGEEPKPNNGDTEEAGAYSEPDRGIINTSDEWNFSFGGGYAHTINFSVSGTSFVQQSIRWGRVFSGSEGDRWYDGSWQFGLEVSPAFIVLQSETVYGAGVTPVIRRLFTAHGKLVPTMTIGVGVLATTAKVPEGETHFNFTPQIAFGVYYFLNPRNALSLEYRFHHISNGGISAPNPGINSSAFLVGISLFK